MSSLSLLTTRSSAINLWKELLFFIFFNYLKYSKMLVKYLAPRNASTCIFENSYLEKFLKVATVTIYHTNSMVVVAFAFIEI